ncbi:MAG: TrmH family RNA methyltransferase [Cyclobacteriaceae bacterium]
MNESERLFAYFQEFFSEQRMQRVEEVMSWRTRHFAVAVEDVYQEHNASAIIRTCDCLGIQELHIMERGNEFRVAKGMARGAEKWVDVHYYQEPPHENSALACLKVLKQQGYQIVATSPHYDHTPATFNITPRSAFFYGHEKYGLSEAETDQADQFISIPAYGFTESYNVSVAAALLLNDLVPRLHQSSGIKWHLSDEEKLEKRIDWAKKSILNVEKILERYYDNDR